MRDDLTGFNIGGNKVRKLDFLIGDARKKRADTLISTGSCSFTLNAAAAGKMFGFDVHLVIPGDQHEHNPASRSLFKQCGADLHYVAEQTDEAVKKKYREILKGLEEHAGITYELVPGGSDEIGALGYIKAFRQIVQYTNHSGISFNKIILATGSTATQVGLVLGQCITGYNTRIVGMAISQKSEIQYQRVLKLALSTAQMLDIRMIEKSIHIEDRFMGPGYAVPTDKGEEAARLFAVHEGILLDPVYTGKAAAGLIDYARNGLFAPNDNILFVHTGGNAGLFQ